MGGTFAKYVTSGYGHEYARVAKFGVTMSVANDKAFKQTYDTDNDSISGTISKSVEYSGNGDENLVAPGTKGSEPVVLSIKGTPEVAVNVKIAAEGLDVVLKTGTYPDLTTAAARDTFILENDYHPITYTLTKNGAATPVIKGNLNDIVDYLNERSGNYPAKTDLTSEIGEYELSWEWKFDGGNDKADTLLGTLAALGPNSLGVNLENYSPQVLLKLTATVTQID